MESPFKTPPGSEKFLENADKIARRDFGTNTNNYTRTRTDLSKNQHRDVLITDRRDKDEFRENPDWEVVAKRNYGFLIKNILPDTDGKKKFSRLDMKSGPYNKEKIINQLLQKNYIKNTGQKITFKKDTHAVYELIENPAEEIKDK